ncbi:oligosaccharide flippase family protein [Mucilaginibacter arboris]|uniref:Oligosaccharide flippase family protein n=1 Tax=Mucilaginibacter arboris TaxID=2682090 RepID=A0A7K1SX79_9SPHI|nr:oligosaccharide flippase family protein [Mucilaginibacter arboris]MVN21912.1 oligosaccharide flippase family protein [Mucilaginibacter arboris]
MLIRKFWSRFNNIYFLSLAGNGIISILGMLTYAVLSRSLSLEGLGVWVFFAAVVGLLDTIRSGFIVTAFIKFYSGTTHLRAAEVCGSTWYIAIVLTLLVVIVNIPASFIINYTNNAGLILSVKWFSVYFIVTLPVFIAGCLLQAQQSFGALLYLRFINQGLFIVFIVLLIVLKLANINTIIYSFLSAQFITSIICFAKGWTNINTFSKRTKNCIAELFHFGKYSVGTTLSANLFRSSDTFIINFMLGPAALAIYNLGQKLMELVEIPLRSYAAVGMPIMSVAFNQNNRGGVIYIMKKYTGMLTLVLVPLAIASYFLADYAVLFIGGKQYAGTEAANVFRIFITFALLYPADRFLALTLDVIHQPQVNFIKVLVMLAINIITDFVGIYIFKNIYGVAIATVFPVLTGVLVGYWYLKKYLKFDFKDIYVLGYRELEILAKATIKKLKLVM